MRLWLLADCYIFLDFIHAREASHAMTLGISGEENIMADIVLLLNQVLISMQKNVNFP